MCFPVRRFDGGRVADVLFLLVAGIHGNFHTWTLLKIASVGSVKALANIPIFP
jgi:hypothetical protein